MKPPVSTGALAATAQAAPEWTGNVGWSTAMFSEGGTVYMIAYDGSVPAGPWALYYVDGAWSSVRLVTVMSLPATALWLDDCGWGPTPGRLVCLATTSYEAWKSQTAISEVESADYGRTWKFTGRTWSPPGGARAFEAGYLRRLEDGGVWQDVVILTVGNGGHAANGEGDWKIAMMYKPGTSAPVTRLLELPPGWSR
jgi:hypothetical protein